MEPSDAVPNLQGRAARLGWATTGLLLVAVGLLAFAVWLLATGDRTGRLAVSLPVDVEFRRPALVVLVGALVGAAATFLCVAALNTATAMRVLSPDRQMPAPLSPKLKVLRRGSSARSATASLTWTGCLTGRYPRSWAQIGYHRGPGCAAPC